MRPGVVLVFNGGAAKLTGGFLVVAVLHVHHAFLHVAVRLLDHYPVPHGLRVGVRREFCIARAEHRSGGGQNQKSRQIVLNAHCTDSRLCYI